MPATARNAARSPGTTLGFRPTSRAAPSRFDGEFNVAWFRVLRKGAARLLFDLRRLAFCDPIGEGLDRRFAMGAFDSPTGTTIAKHIFVADKGDYYEIKDGLPQNAQ